MTVYADVENFVCSSNEVCYAKRLLGESLCCCEKELILSSKLVKVLWSSDASVTEDCDGEMGVLEDIGQCLDALSE